MLKKLRIKNFKCWKDTGEMTMAPLTVFFGTNSSGKSSIGQFLMLLKQTANFLDRKTVLHFGDGKSAGEFGSYEDMVYAHESNHGLQFEYEWECTGPLEFENPDSKQQYQFDVMHFDAEIGLLRGAKTKQSPYVKKFCYRLSNSEDNAQSLQVDMRATGESNAKYKLEADGYDLKRIHGRPWPIGAPVHFFAFPDMVSRRYQNADFLADLSLQHRELFASMSYLGPLREKAQRIYSWSGFEPESVGYLGEHTIPAMLAAQERLINLRHRQHRQEFNKIIVAELQKMGLVKKIEVMPLSTKRQREYEVKVATAYSKDRDNLWGDSLLDVGVGVAQVLPVLVQCFYAPPGSIIIMEQPEIHLHPSAQSALADVMIDAILSREDGFDRNIQLIIETHSEHFLRRLQLRIAEQNEITEKEVEAYSVKPVGGRAHLDSLKIDEYGNIQNWPEDFFGDEIGDVVKIAEAKRNRRRAQMSG
ncbi:MAG: DUF3696 domain-containing protein [Alphaproteobacteria bacterium]|nr:DUF3696 domain-containing protein [Alphaproteobacteria bacterium]